MLVPLFARVLLERQSLQNKTSLIIPKSAEKRNAPSEGVVLSVGPTCDESIKALVGKRVLFGRFAGDWFEDPSSGTEFYICADEDIIAEIRDG